jgi:hypothetical protein
MACNTGRELRSHDLGHAATGRTVATASAKSSSCPHNLSESFHAFNLASGVIEDVDAPLLLDSWDRFWDSSAGSEEESMAFAGWLLRHTEQIVVWIDQATAYATADRISPEA